MPDLTSRQQDLLRALVDEYIETAEPVGSDMLDRRYNLGVSPATIRAEMVRLTDLGYLKKPHASSGRTPTAMGMKYYVHELMKPKSLSVKDEVLLKERLWEDRFEYARLMREACRAIAQYTHALGVVVTDEGDIFTAGVANILDMPEFYDIDVAKEVLTVVDDAGRLQEIVALSQEDAPIHVIMGEDIGHEFLAPVGFVFTRFEAGTRNHGVIGVVGPMRLNYALVVPTVDYVSGLIREVTSSW